MLRSLVLMPFLATLFLAACQGPLQTEPPRPRAPESVSPGNASIEPRRSPLPVGSPVPRFELLDQNGNAVSAEELTTGKGSVLLFIPSPSKPAARPAISWVRKNQSFLSQQGLEVLLVTPQGVEANRGLSEREDLRLALLADPASWVARGFGVADDEAPSRPWTFVLGSNGRIQVAEAGLPSASDLVVAARTLPGAERESIFMPF